MAHCELQQIKIKNKSCSRCFTLQQRESIGESSSTLVIPHPDVTNDKNGRKIPLIGISGGGKSTLINILSTIAWPSEGSIKWDMGEGSKFCWDAEKPLQKDDVLRLRRDFFGFVFQDSTLTPYLSVKENLLYPQLLKGTSTLDAKKNVMQYLQKLFPHPKELADAFPHQISGGERQRVALAQSLIAQPIVLFADEPAGSLDQSTRSKIMAILDTWVTEDPKRLLIWVTHNPDDEKMVPYYLKIAQIGNENYFEWEASSSYSSTKII